jgi:type I restriction enzyme, S subunit
MDAEQLLEHFDRVAEAPGSIAALRRFILDLAVRGKLVDQDPNDEPASELLKRIQSEKEQLVKSGKIKKDKSNSPVTDEEISVLFYANHCTYERLGNIAILQKGLTGIKQAQPGSFPLVVTAEERSSCDHFDFEGSAAIIPMVSSTGHGNASMKRLHYQEGKFALGNILCAVFPITPQLISARFIYEYLTAFKEDLLVSQMLGTANVSLTINKISNIPIPIVSPANQERAYELMGLCDRLEAAQKNRENLRDRLVAASLHQLNQAADSNEEFFDRARFYFDNLAKLSVRSEHISQLRQTILNFAVSSKLVSQSPSDELATDLLKQVRAEKIKLVKDGTIPKQKMSLTDSVELAFNCPVSWEKISFSDVCNLVTSGSRGWAEYYSNSGAKFIRAQNIRFGKLKLDDIAYVELPKKTEGTRTQLSHGDILIVITGAGVTNPALLDVELGEAYVSQHVALVKPTKRELSQWLLLCLMAPIGGRNDLLERAYGSGKPGLNLDNIRSLKIALPPLTEQNRIISKVNELMVLCDRLEIQIGSTQVDSHQLLESLIKETLSEPA